MFTSACAQDATESIPSLCTPAKGSLIAKILRTVANDMLREAHTKEGEASAEGVSAYICFNLTALRSKRYNLQFSWHERASAKRFLHGLGMGDGMDEFAEFNEGLERQFVRVTFLLFAADLAEEGAVA